MNRQMRIAETKGGGPTEGGGPPKRAVDSQDNERAVDRHERAQEKIADRPPLPLAALRRRPEKTIVILCS